MQTSALLGAKKHRIFLKFVVSVRTGGKGQFFEIFYGRLLWTVSKGYRHEKFGYVLCKCPEFVILLYPWDRHVPYSSQQ